MIRISVLIGFIVVWIIAMELSGTILTVDNKIPSIGQYSTFQAAYNVAMDGDTIYVYPSLSSYTPCTIAKRIHIIGSGLLSNYRDDGITNSKFRGAILAFSAGSEASSIIGMEFLGGSFYSAGLTISNCYSTGIMAINGNDVVISNNRIAAVHVMDGRTNVTISGNIIDNYGYFGYPSSIGIGIGCMVSVFNNIIIPANSSPPYIKAIYVNDSSNAYVLNNVIKVQSSSLSEFSLYAQSAAIYARNNILGNLVYSESYEYFLYNIAETDILPSNNFNTQVGTISDLFVDMANGDFHLAPGSAAIGAGEGGIDCGAYGGIAPFDDYYYLPPLPAIIGLSTPSTIVSPDEPLPVQIRATTLGY